MICETCKGKGGPCCEAGWVMTGYSFGPSADPVAFNLEDITRRIEVLERDIKSLFLGASTTATVQSDHVTVPIDGAPVEVSLGMLKAGEQAVNERRDMWRGTEISGGFLMDVYIAMEERRRREIAGLDKP